MTTKYELDPDRVKNYIVKLKRKVSITVQNTNTKHHYVFTLRRKKDNNIEVTCKLGYIGQIIDEYYIPFINKFRPDEETEKAEKIFAAIIKRYVNSFKPFNDIVIYHHGICSVCGRPLTTPESIKAGIGPVCEQLINQ